MLDEDKPIITKEANNNGNNADEFMNSLMSKDYFFTIPLAKESWCTDRTDLRTAYQ